MPEKKQKHASQMSDVACDNHTSTSSLCGYATKSWPTAAQYNMRRVNVPLAHDALRGFYAPSYIGGEKTKTVPFLVIRFLTCCSACLSGLAFPSLTAYVFTEFFNSLFLQGVQEGH